MPATDANLSTTPKRRKAFILAENEDTARLIAHLLRMDVYGRAALARVRRRASVRHVPRRAGLARAPRRRIASVSVRRAVVDGGGSSDGDGPPRRPIPRARGPPLAVGAAMS